MIVMKFGGTSNEDAVAMRNVVRIVRAHLEEQPVVVISAIARATNELEQTAGAAARGDEEKAGAIVHGLFDRHARIIDNLVQDRSRAAEIEALIFGYLAEIKALVKGIAILKELTPRTMDAICSYGERLSSRIIAAALEEEGVPAAWVDAREFMITDDNFGAAQPVMSVICERLEHVVRPLVGRGKVPVTQGFIGATAAGAYTTMGRESSDYSASIIGAAMNATRVQIWTDVDGILTADPRVVRNTLKVRKMSFAEAFELSYFGAKVLHPGTMLPVLEKKIPVQILNSRRDSGTGTWIDTGGEETALRSVPKSIAHRKNLTMITVTPRKRITQFLFWESLYSVLSRHNLSTGMTVTSEYSLAASVDSGRLSESIIHELEEFGEVKVFPGKGSICLVGHGLRGGAGILERVFRSLSEFNVLMVCHGPSESNLTLLLDEDRIPQAVERLHAEFFERTGDGGAFDRLP